MLSSPGDEFIGERLRALVVSSRFNPDLSGWKPEVEFVRERLRALMVFSRFNPDLSGWELEVEFVRERLVAADCVIAKMYPDRLRGSF